MTLQREDENEVQEFPASVFPRFKFNELHRHTSTAENQGEELAPFPFRHFVEVRRIPSP